MGVVTSGPNGGNDMTKPKHFAALTVTAAVAFSVAACHQGPKGGAADPDAAKKAIAAEEKTWNDQFQAKPRDIEALLGYYADDAYFIAPGVKAADGGTAIRRAYAEGLADPNFTISFASDKIDVASSGDLAYARGRFTEKYTDPATRQVMSTSGSYITVFKKQPDGSWKAEEDFAASDPDATKPVPPAKPATRAKMVSF